MVEPMRFFLEGIMLGLATGHICLATCGPVYASYLMQENRTNLRYLTSILEMSAGRFVTYISIGAIAGAFGRQIADLQRDWFSLVAYLLFSAYLIVSARRSGRCDGGCATPRWNRFAKWPFVLGLLTGINVCPSFLLALTRSFTHSGPIAGMLFFAAFFVGTSVFLLPLTFVGMLGKKLLFRKIARIAAYGVAAWFIVQAGIIGWGLAKPLFDSRPIINLLDEAPMYVVLDDQDKAQKSAARLAKGRKGQVFVGEPRSAASAQYYLVTDTAHAAGRTDATMNTPGCFMLVLPDRYLGNSDSLGKAMDFLKMYHFRFNAKKGNLFYMR
jgi:sulfite exporter TauE/SafE